MEILWIVLGIFILYARCLNHHFMIDDNVRRWGYLYCIPETSPPHSFYNTKPSKWRHLFPIITHALNTIVINQIWGWKTALLFAIHPMAVPGASWITGGYYSVTAFFALTAYYFIHSYHLIGALIGSLFFTAALGSTITCIGFPFIFLFQEHQGLVCLWPLVMYLFGKRFITGFNIRNNGRKDKITYKKIAVIPKVVAHYILMGLVPNQLAFFRQFGFEYSRDSKMKKEVESFNGEWVLSSVLCIMFALAGWTISPFGTLWFFIMILPFSQFKMLGQFVAERYAYLPQIGIAIILSTALSSHPIIFAIVCTLYLYRSHIYINAYRHMKDLYLDGIRNYPECVTNYANLAELYLQSGETLRAYQTLEEGFKLDPDCFLLHCNMAAYWIGVNNIERGIAHTRRAVEVHSAEEDMAGKVMRKQIFDLENILAERKVAMDKIDEEIARENIKPKKKRVLQNGVLQSEIDRIKEDSFRKAKNVLKENHELISR